MSAVAAATARGLSVAACAPGRVCLAGESLDWMTGGPSVTAAVPLHTTVTATLGAGTGGGLVLCSPVAQPSRREVDVSALGRYGGDELDYLQAVAAVVTAGRPVRLLAGAHLDAASTVPVGAGLSSSAALTIAAAGALLRLVDSATPDPAAVAEVAYHAEVGQLGTGAGWMDFLACAHGGVCRIEAAAPPHTTRLAGTLGVAMVLVDTRQRRATSTVLASKRDRYRSGEPDMRAYARSATRIVEGLTAELRTPAPDWQVVGGWINQAQTVLRALVRCSTPLIDECVTRLLAAGAYGAKLTGSGHGGCLFALTPAEAIEPVVAALRDLPVRVMVFTTGEARGIGFPA